MLGAVCFVQQKKLWEWHVGYTTLAPVPVCISRASRMNSKAYSYNCMLCAQVRTVPSELCFICKRAHTFLSGHHFLPFEKLEVCGFWHIKLTYNCSDITKKACGVPLVVVREVC